MRTNDSDTLVDVEFSRLSDSAIASSFSSQINNDGALPHCCNHLLSDELGRRLAGNESLKAISAHALQVAIQCIP